MQKQYKDFVSKNFEQRNIVEKKRLLALGDKIIIKSGFEDDGIVKYEPNFEKDKEDRDGLDSWML